MGDMLSMKRHNSDGRVLTEVIQGVGTLTDVISEDEGADLHAMYIRSWVIPCQINQWFASHPSDFDESWHACR